MNIRLFLVSAALCLCSLCAFSQEIEWQNTIGGSGEDRLFSIQQTTDKGYILGGYSSSGISGDKTENSNGVYDYWIVKTDSLGTLQWQNTIGGSDSEWFTAIQQTVDGGYILGGHSLSNISGDKTENCIGDTDYWIVKTDDTGIIQWQNTIGGSSGDQLNSIQQTTDGGFILGGSSQSNISGDKTENAIGNFSDDYWIVKTDAYGIIQWQNTIGGSKWDYLMSVSQTSDGGYILGGYSKSDISGDKTENSNGDYDYWIVKTDSLGIIQWQNTIGGSSYDHLNSIKQTSDGGFILGGYSQSDISGDKTENSNGNSLNDYWIVKTDSSGIIQWQNTLGGSYEERVYSIQQTTDGGYVLGGYSMSNISGDKTETNIGDRDYWIVKIDSSGKLLWQNTIGGIKKEELTSIQQTSDGGFILGGYSDSNISGDKTENNLGSYHDYWIVKVSTHFNSITGKLFLDINSNTMQDSGELPLINKKVIESNTGRMTFSGQNGYFHSSVLDSGNFTVFPPLINYYTVVPSNQSVYFPGIPLTDSLNDFAFQPAGVFNDLCVSITPQGPFRAGFNASYQITYQNLGTTTLTPTVIFYLDDDLSFVAAAPAASTVALDSLLWNFGPMAPFQSGTILVTVNVDFGTPIGSLINSGAVIEPITGDANTQCNQSYWEVFTTGSYDPNDILVDQDTLLTTQFPSPPYLEYIIRFQNTGNDTAFTARILNPIDTFKLQLNSFEFVTASHPVNLTWIPWERNMEFRFENILLPDSNTNEPASHGFVRYRIKPNSNLSLGDTIKNLAAIYFDFNFPVITNTAITRVVLPTGIEFLGTANATGTLLLYPNPAKSKVTIEAGMLSAPSSQLIISDVAGRVVCSKTIFTTSTQQNIDIGGFSNGIYIVQVKDGERITRGRFVKE